MPQDLSALVAQLREAVEQLHGCGIPSSSLYASAAAALETQAAEIARLTAERDKLKTVMIAAAEEIAAHWDAHCDADGYGPVNLQRRLEEGIPSEYGYTAGAFAALRAERDGLRVDAEVGRQFSELWYFVMDEAPLEFEKIVSEWTPARWLDQAQKLRAAREST